LLATNAKQWLSIDSISYGGVYLNVCNSQIPSNANGFQYPKTGNGAMISTFYCFQCGRGYLKNRLKATLLAGKRYCVKFHVNISNMSPRGMDGFGAYFGDNSIDTITKNTIPLAYINPQIRNPIGNVISDTLHWVPITGTFVANGTEKYVLLGNFLADTAVTTTSINTPYYPQKWTDVLIDDVSCIDIDLPAYAGPDQPLIAGDSVYIGRELDFAVDSACTWYQLPNTTMPIKKASGLWVKPVTTTTYVVKQEIYCGTVKWDTVVVFMTSVGIKSLKDIESKINVYPNPAHDAVQIQYPGEAHHKGIISIYNQLGQLVREEKIDFKNETASLSIADLPNGVYTLHLDKITIKKLLIAR